MHDSDGAEYQLGRWYCRQGMDPPELLSHRRAAVLVTNSVDLCNLSRVCCRIWSSIRQTAESGANPGTTNSHGGTKSSSFRPWIYLSRPSESKGNPNP